MNKRLVWADVVRVLAIYFIVVLHVITIPPVTHADGGFFVALALIDTCVPLLVLLSGSLLLEKKESYAVFFRKRAMRVVIPWIAWSCIFTAITLVAHANFGLSQIIHTYQAIFIPYFWFIVLICALYLITPALRIFVQNAKAKDIAIVILLWFAAVSVMPYLRDSQAFPLHVDNGIVRLVVDFIGYFLLGFLLVKIKRHKKYRTIATSTFLVAVTVTSALGYLLTQATREYTNDIFAYISPGIFLISTSLFTLLYLLEDFYQKHLSHMMKKILAAASKATLGIYFIHYLFLDRAPLPKFPQLTSIVHFSYSIDMFINGFLIFMLSFGIIFLLQKIPVVGKLLT